MNIFKDQAKFMSKGGQTVTGVNKTQMTLYDGLIIEEFEELQDAIRTESSKAHIVKEVIDCIVVLVGFLFSMGIKPSEAWSLVHANNMAKLNNITKDDSGKIQKSEASKARKALMMTKLSELFN